MASRLWTPKHAREALARDHEITAELVRSGILGGGTGRSIPSFGWLLNEDMWREDLSVRLGLSEWRVGQEVIRLREICGG